MNRDLLAVMVMTHNHPETVEYILNNNLEFYKKYGIDVYICDDGDDNQTKIITERFIAEGFDNLFWKDAHGVIHGDEKYFNAIKRKYTDKEYKYIFPIKDRALFSERIIKLISEAIENENDIIMVVNDFDRWELTLPPIKDVYTDALTFFSHYGQLTTNWRSLIFNSKTILNDKNIEEMDKRFEEIHPFTQTFMTYTGLDKIDNPRIRVIHATQNGDIEEVCKFGSGSGWGPTVFSLWIDTWTKAIFSLPQRYNDCKASVLKAETNLPVLFGSIDGMLAHKGRGTLTKEVLDKYRSMWEMISDVPIEWVDLLLDEDYERLFVQVHSTIDYCLQNHDYETAFYVVDQNQWLGKVKEEYVKLSKIFFRFKLDYYQNGTSNRLDGISSIKEILEKE